MLCKQFSARSKFCFLALQGIFFWNIFNLLLVESMGVELADMHGELYSQFSRVWLRSAKVIVSTKYNIW